MNIFVVQIFRNNGKNENDTHSATKVFSDDILARKWLESEGFKKVVGDHYTIDNGSRYAYIDADAIVA